MINETDYTNNPLTKEQENQIDALFAQYDNTNTPGCSVGVIKDGRFIYKKSFGMANLDYDIPITSNSKFNIGSTTKQFTAACITMLLLDNKLDLNDDVRKYISEFPDYSNTITIRHLLHHTSGLKDYIHLRIFSGDRLDNYFNIEKGLKLICKQKDLNFLPGEEYRYSNSNYLLLAEIVNRVSGKTIREYAEEKLFKPLEMSNTFFSDNSTEIMKNRVVSYSVSRDNVSSFIQNLEALGDGNMVTTLNDLLIWDANFYNPKIGGEEFLKSILTRGVLNNQEEIFYAFGLRHVTCKGIQCVNHGGGFLGFRSEMIRFQKQNTSIILLCNRTDANTDIFAGSITEIVLADEIAKLPTTLPSSEPASTPVNLTQSELENFCGFYNCNNRKLDCKIYLKNGKLSHWHNEEGDSRLVPISNKELLMLDTDKEVRLVFNFAHNNKQFQLFADKQDSILFNADQTIDFNLEYLSRYEGNYLCAELDVVYRLKIVHDRLVLFIDDKQICKVEAVMPDFFLFLEWHCYFSFNYNDSNEVYNFNLGSGIANNIKFIKQF